MRRYFLIVSVAILFSDFLYSQEVAKSGIEKLQLETRFEFDNYYDIEEKVSENGFTGRYLNFNLKGKIDKNISYRYRQRLLPNIGLKNFFDGTDVMYLDYKIGDHISVSGGKQVILVGGFEYDMAPIDVYVYSDFWANITCYALGISASYKDKSGKNLLTLQMTNSPYSGMRWNGSSFSQSASPIDSKFAYNIIWYGKFGHFSTIYSTNFMQRSNDRFINYLALGNKFTFEKTSFYVDIMSRTSNTEQFMKNYSAYMRADIKVSKCLNLFAKAGYDKNISQNPDSITPNQYEDIFVQPGTDAVFYGLGGEIFPLKNDKIRLHFFAAMRNKDKYILQCNAGLTWRMNFINN